MISKQNIDKNDLSIFIRDLSENINFNLKHLIEDNFINNKKDDKKYNNKKKKIIKKKRYYYSKSNRKKKKRKNK